MTGVQTCALPIFSNLLSELRDSKANHKDDFNSNKDKNSGKVNNTEGNEIVLMDQPSKINETNKALAKAA